MTLEAQLRTAFSRFIAEHRADVPRCRERELVSRFAFGPLLSVVRADAPLADPRQIGIEVAVPQQASTAAKRRQPDVCKDLVLWATPGQTCWDGQGRAAHIPMAVIEWKSVDRGERSGVRLRKLEGEVPSDQGWLEWFTYAYPSAEGYLVVVQPEGTGLKVAVRRTVCGSTDPEWMAVGDELLDAVV